MCLSSTLLPLPLAPMMTTLTPRSTFRLTPSSTTRWATRFLTFLNSTRGLAMKCDVKLEDLKLEDSAPENALHTVNGDIPILGTLGEEEVDHDDGDKAGDKTLRTRPADARCAAAAGEAFVAADQGDGSAEEDAFDQAFEDLPVFHALGRVSPVRIAGNAQGFDGDEISADDAQKIAVNRQHREKQETGEESRADQPATRGRSHDAQGGELLRDGHRSQLGSQRAAGAAGQ